MQKCPSCPRAGADIGTCGHIAMCPGTSVPVEPGKDVVLHCEPCEKTRVISVVDLIHGRKKGLDMQCPRGDTCACRVVNLSTAEKITFPGGKADAAIAAAREAREAAPLEVVPGRKAGGRGSKKAD